MTAEEKARELEAAVARLHKVLQAREYGLMTWWAAVGTMGREVHRLLTEGGFDR